MRWLRLLLPYQTMILHEISYKPTAKRFFSTYASRPKEELLSDLCSILTCQRNSCSSGDLPRLCTEKGIVRAILERLLNVITFLLL